MNGRRIELRELEPGGPIELRGHAATFDEPYPVGSFTETIARGAFKRTLGEYPDVSLLVNHAGAPLARTTSGTMQLTEDATGLHVRAELEPSDPDVQAILPKMRRGDMNEMSFAFRANRQSWSDDKTERLVQDVGIHRGDVSLVTAGANPSATASLRAEALTLEQRQRIADRIGERVCGPYSAPMLGGLEGRRGARSDHAAFVARSELDIAKARRARLGGRRDYRADDHPRYTDAQIQKLGEEGKALKRKDGKTYHYPIVNGRDVTNAVRAWGRAVPSEREAVRRWISKRAVRLRVTYRLPDSWAKSVAHVEV